MPVYLVAAAQALFYLGAVPLHAAAFVDCGGDLRYGAGVSAFDYRRAVRRASASRHRRRRRPGPTPGQTLRFLRALRVERLEISGHACLGDAALTALFCGGLNAAAHALPCPSRSGVRADFAGQAVSVRLEARLTVRLGRVALAMLSAALRREHKSARIPGCPKASP